MVKHIFFLSFLFLFSCVNKDEIFFDTLEVLESRMTDAERDLFANGRAEEASTIYFKHKLEFENQFLNGNKDKDLILYFKRLGVYNIDDISKITFTSLHRKLNAEPIELEEQINSFKHIQSLENDCEEKLMKQALELCNKFNVGDSVCVKMPVRNYSDTKLAVNILCPNSDWTFDKEKDLILEGVITEKIQFKDDACMFFKVKVYRMNDFEILVLGQRVISGAVIPFALKYVQLDSLPCSTDR